MNFGRKSNNTKITKIIVFIFTINFCDDEVIKNAQCISNMLNHESVIGSY